MLSTAINLPTRKVFIYENSRFIPVTGWTTKGLFLTDRKALSNRDGSEGYNSLEDASEALLSKGWIWDGDSAWCVEKALTDIDADGWSYSVDFGHFTNGNVPDAMMTCGGSAIKGAMHFVRRRKLGRIQYFDVSTITDISSFTCDHCDLQEVEKLSKALLEKLAQASINRHPRSISERKINILKNDILASLQLLSEVPNTLTSTVSMTPYNFESTIELLDNFIARSRTTLSMASSMLGSGDVVDNWNVRLLEVRKYFADDERNEVARLILRKHDSHYDFHCNQRNCGPSCIFAVEQCVNNGCFVCFSRKYTLQHDSICPEKPLPCERQCGEIILRKCMRNHLQDNCILRPVHCPYECTGCQVEGLRFCDLTGHLQDATQSHMDMMLTCMMQQQSVITSLHQQVQQLEQARASQQSTIEGLEVALVASAAALKVSEARNDKAIRDEISRLEARVGKTTSLLGSDIAQIRKNMMGGDR